MVWLFGCTLWLPRIDQIHQDLAIGLDIDDGCFDHSAVVLSVDPEEIHSSPPTPILAPLNPFMHSIMIVFSFSRALPP